MYFSGTGLSFNDGISEACRPCPLNRRPNSQFTACDRLICLAGQEALNGICKNCRPGFASSSASSVCQATGLVCGPGNGIIITTVGPACSQCPVNAFCELGGCLNSFSSGCNPCPPNTGAQLPGSSMCTPLGFGSSSAPFRCPEGMCFFKLIVFESSEPTFLIIVRRIYLFVL
jgi:hypothetical protein